MSTQTSPEPRIRPAGTPNPTEPVTPPAKVALVVTGNPNVGKSVVFHWLTGRYATVSNYPGTTVTVTHGRTVVDGRSELVYDTPGVNSLMANSEDELVTRRLVLGDGTRVILQVADAKHLERALALTLEFAEGGLPVVLDLNMVDEARERRITIDTERLAIRLGIPVVQTIATQRWGFDRLSRALTEAAVPSCPGVVYPEPIQGAVEELERALPLEDRGRRAWALLWLADEPDARERFERTLDESTFRPLAARVNEVRHHVKRPLGTVISQSRLRAARAIAAEVVSREPKPRRPWLQRFADATLRPFPGWGIALGALWAVYLLVGHFGAQTCVEFLENVVFGRFINPAATWLVTTVMPFQWLQDLLVGE